MALATSGMAEAAEAAKFNIPAQPLSTALAQFGVQSEQGVFVDSSLTDRKFTQGVSGDKDAEVALNELLTGTGLGWRREGATFVITRTAAPQSESAAGSGAEVEALIVTAQKREEDIQDVPIAISAFTQEDLTRSQIAGGPDLMTQVPNMTFTKTNFTSYSIQIRGIGTQAISATTDAAVAVAFNNTPFIRNRFFEQEFYDLARIEVLRGPQGTLYGRNATAGVVNIISAKPRFEHEARLSADVANYSSTRLEGMVNIPLVDDIVALRVAGAWTKRDGFVTNELNNQQIDGRDLWSTRVSLRIEPTDSFRANLIWEHFEEDDDRLRSGKQLCRKHTPTEIGGIPVPQDSGHAGSVASTFSQGCLPASMYSPDAYQTPNGFALPYFAPLGQIGAPIYNIDPYVSASQSRDLRVIESTRDAEYRARSDLAELQLEFDVTPGLTLTSETSYAADFTFGTQDFNRFNTKPGAFNPAAISRIDVLDESGVFCDPQVGCSDRLVLVDLATAKSHHFSQELRLSSDFEGPFNFSLGTNFLRYDTEDKYYVFANSLTLWAANASWSRGMYDITGDPYVGGVSDNLNCLRRRHSGNPEKFYPVQGCIYVDPNPIGALNDQGHNYFLSKNPYRLISYAAFGEAYYNITPNLKLTGGLRWTVDKKHAPRIPSWLIAAESYGYPVMEVVDQEWREPTGRLTIDWKPALDFTDETLLYASYARGYKAGGMNPPPAVIATYGTFGDASDAILGSLVQSPTFDAEYVDAFEVGAKNTFADGAMTLNASAFHYDYKGYQISQIINRSALNSNFDAKIWGIELEADWKPVENFRLSFKGGYQNTRMAGGSRAIDLMDRAAGDPNYVVIRPFPTVPSNCIIPLWYATWGGHLNGGGGTGSRGTCVDAYMAGVDPVTRTTYVPDPTVDLNGLPLDSAWAGYPGFDPSTVPNNGEGIYKDLSGNDLPNAPNYTATISADYTLPLPNDWLMTLHSDLYYQSEAWTRIFNMEGYDKLKAYTNVNLAAIFTNEDAGWKVMAYVKNVFDKDSITGAFLNSDDTGLTTNVFLTEPRLYGLRVTKQWTGGALSGGWWRDRGEDRAYPLTIELGGGASRHGAPDEVFSPAFIQAFDTLAFPLGVQDDDLDWGDSRDVKLTYRPSDGAWSAWGAARFGKTNGTRVGEADDGSFFGCIVAQYICDLYPEGLVEMPGNFGDASTRSREEYMIADFMIGRDVGLGGLESTLAFGLRYVDMESTSEAELWGMPDIEPLSENVFFAVSEFSRHAATFSADRSFKGTGPMVSWDASKTLWANERGKAAVDFGVTGGVLFGRRHATIDHEVVSHYFSGVYVFDLQVTEPYLSKTLTDGRGVSESATVPTAGANLGLSYSVGGLKFGAGYRWERYFDAIDGGIGKAKSYDRTIDGPYFKLSVGFGG